ncbi:MULTISPECIES: hypothetical protein [Clostridia]|uniref:hypothetical protein n=1 Tax=Clostridia TaxID=186801 RepID=UPI0024BC618E|nr:MULTISPECIES: hypothetical protein [Eubacteriales]WRR94021.1 hypothetical protein U5921_02550 [Sinanaerobacter sp. ZZT-01]
MEYEEIMDIVIAELSQRALSRQREEDEALDQKILRRIEVRGRIEQCISTLSEPEQQLFQEYFEITLDISGMQEGYLYMQGAKDCVRFLKDLGVL